MVSLENQTPSREALVLTTIAVIIIALYLILD